MPNEQASVGISFDVQYEQALQRVQTFQRAVASGWNSGGGTGALNPSDINPAAVYLPPSNNLGPPVPLPLNPHPDVLPPIPAPNFSGGGSPGPLSGAGQFSGGSLTIQTVSTLVVQQASVVQIHAATLQGGMSLPSSAAGAVAVAPAGPVEPVSPRFRPVAYGGAAAGFTAATGEEAGISVPGAPMTPRELRTMEALLRQQGLPERLIAEALSAAPKVGGAAPAGAGTGAAALPATGPPAPARVFLGESPHEAASKSLSEFASQLQDLATHGFDRAGGRSFQDEMRETMQSWRAPASTNLSDFRLPSTSPRAAATRGGFFGASDSLSDAGMDRYYADIKAGRTDVPFEEWQQRHLPAYQQHLAQGGTSSFSEFLTGPQGGSGPGTRFLQQMLGGIPGVGQTLAGAGAAVAVPAAAAYAAHLALGMGQAALAPAIGMQAVTNETLAAQVLAPLASVPILGAPVAMLQSRALALGSVRDQAAVQGAVYGQNSADLERTAVYGGARGFTDQAYDAISFLNPFLGVGRTLIGDNPLERSALATPPGVQQFRFLKGQDISEARGALFAANPGASAAQVDAQLRSIESNPALGGRPEAIKAVIRLTASAEEMRGSNAYLAGEQAAGAELTSSDVRTLAQEAAARGDLGTVQRMQQTARTRGWDPGSYQGLIRTSAQILRLGAEGQIAGAETGLVAGRETRAQATLAGGAALAGIIGEEGPALQRQLQNTQARLQALRGMNQADPNIRIQVLQAEQEQQQTETQLASLPIRQVQARYESASTLAQAQTGTAQALFGLAQTRGVGSAGMTEAFTAQTAGVAGRVAAAQARLDSLRATGTAGPEALAQAETEVRAAQAEQSGLGITRADTRFAADYGVAGRTVSLGQAGLTGATMTRFLTGGNTEAAAAVATIQEGLQAQLRAAAAHLAELLKDPGVGSGKIAEARAQVQEAQNAIAQNILSVAQQKAADAMTVAATPGQVAGAALGAQAALGMAPSAGMQAAQLASAQATALTSRQNAADARARGDERSALMWDAQAAQAGAALATLPLQQLQAQIAPEQMRAQAAASGAQAVLGAQAALGVAPSAAAQAQQTAAAGATLAAEQHLLAGMLSGAVPADSALIQQQRARVAAAEAGIATLPLQQLQARIAPEQIRAQAASGIAGAELGIARTAGLGGAETREIQLAQVQAAQNALAADQHLLEGMRSGAVPADSALIQQQEARVAQGRLGVAQSRTTLGQVDIPLPIREAREQTQFELGVLRNLPGTYGSIRGLLGRQIGNIEQEANVLIQEYQQRGPEMSEEGRHQIRTQLRQLGTEQAGAFQELSVGWENRLMSRVINNPGSFNLEGRGMSLMNSVMAGVMNPHFGSTGRDLPFFLRESALAPIPSLGLPGVRELPGSETGRFGPGVADPTRFLREAGGAGTGMGSGRIVGPGATGTMAHRQDGNTHRIVVEIVVKSEDGRILGKGGGNVTAGGVNAALTSGGLEDLLNQIGVISATQQ